ncbi:hypothetical protein HRbin36_01261 [bacterium HR36]|nr:hypothetical protein HRbin36_01261 [bacterium HR36]
MLAKVHQIGLALALVAIWGMYAPTATACPGCKEAVAAQDIEADSDVYNPSQLARAYNYSIYLMLAMPYLLTAFFGAACYIMMRRARNNNGNGNASGKGSSTEDARDLGVREEHTREQV